MGSSGLEPPTSCLSGTRSNHLSYEPISWLGVLFRFPLGGDDGIRTHDPLLAGQVLSQLSYTPIFSLQGFFFRQSLKIEQQIPVSTYTKTSPQPFRFLFFFARFQVTTISSAYFLHRKEVIQPHLPIRLPCYDLTPIIGPTLDSCPLAVSSLALGVPNFHGLTGGVYKARERIHRGMLIRDY